MTLVNKKKVGNIAFSVFRTLFFIGMIYVLLFPLFVMLSRSLRTVEDMYNPAIIWIPQHFTLANFKEAAKLLNYSSAALKTGRLALLCTLLSMASCSMAGYALGHYKLKCNTLFTVIAVLTIIVPLQAYIIPLFFRFRFFDFLGIGSVLELFGADGKVNLVNGELPYYILAVTGMGIRSGLFIWIFMQFFRSMPRELDDAARIDGCGEAATFIRIMLPNALSPYLVTFILSIVWYWNDTAYSGVFSQKNPLLATSMNNLKALLLAEKGATTRGDGTGETVIIFAAALIYILPPLIMYLFAQKAFMQGIERTGIVG